MISKVLFVLFNAISIVVMVTGVRMISGNMERFAICLRRLMMAAAAAVLSCICVALAPSTIWAEVAFCFYFVSIDWIAFYLLGYCLGYTNHHKIYKLVRWPAMIIMIIDSISIFLNLVFGHQFTVFTLKIDDNTFYQYSYTWPYAIHLALDYLAIGIGFFVIIMALIKSPGFYKMKYLIIFSIITSLILLNIGYMAFSLPLDWSVTFYALGSMLMYYYSIHYTPNTLIAKFIQSAANEMNEGMIMFDTDNNCIFFNEFVRRYLGFEHLSECRIDVIPANAVLVDGKMDGEDSIKQIIVEGRNGKRDERFRVHFSSLRDKHGRRLGAYFRLERITDEYNNMILLEQAREEANRASKAKSNFLANMSHEIRTPINSVLGMNEMILREADNPQILEYAQNIQSAGNSLLGLINDILDFSKVEAGKMDLIPDVYNIHKVLRDALHMLESRAEGKGLKLLIDCDENIPAGLYGDENRIRQILTNVITNGIKYTKEGSVSVNTHCEMIDEDNGRLILEVKDTGIGISEADRAKLFDAFQRVDENHNRNIEGTGLGLAITKQLLALMDGEILVESEVGKGSVFTIIIPQGIKNKAPVGRFERTAEVKKNSYREKFTAPEAVVLVVDDVPMNIKVVQALLKKTKIQIDTSTDGNEAFEMCKSKKYDLILMDHMMPEPDGIATFNMIRQEGMNTDTSVIVLTANAINGVEKEYSQVGFSDYLSKPVKGDILESMLMKYLPGDKVIVAND